MDLLIHSNQIITESGNLDGIIAVKAGKIVGLYESEIKLDAKKVIDARGKVVLPGAIDTHAHIRFPAFPEREDLVTGTTSAAAGGFTTIFEMPVSNPGVSTAEILQERMEMAKKESVVDIALYAGGGHGASESFLSMAAAGAIAYKVFLHRAPHGAEDVFYGLSQIDDGELLSDLYKLKDINRVVCFHAESDPILEHAKKRVEKNGISGESAHSQSHPEIAEIEAISRVILFAEQTGTPVSIVHVSTTQGAQIIKDAKQRGVKVYAETCPHYLFASEKDFKRVGAYAKINPPLRSEKERLELWEYVQDGTIDYIGTDHGPYSKAEKEKGKDNILNASSGMPGFETQMPLLLTAVTEGKLSYHQVAKLTARNQARIFGIDNHKGSISIGKDADFSIIDPSITWKIDHTKMKTKARDIALLWDGKQVKGKVETTVVRGSIVFQNGELQVSPGYGNVITPV